MKRLSQHVMTIIVAATMLLCTLATTSCNGVGSPTLRAAVAIANKELPIDLGNGMTAVSIAIEDNYVVYVYEAPTEAVLILQESDLKTLAYEELRLNIQQDEDVRTFMELCVESNYGIIYRYTDNEGNVAEILTSCSDLATLL